MKPITELVTEVVKNKNNKGLMHKWINGTVSNLQQKPDETIICSMVGCPKDKYNNERSIRWFVVGNTAKLVKSNLLGVENSYDSRFGDAIARLVKTNRFSKDGIDRKLDQMYRSTSIPMILQTLTSLIDMCIHQHINVNMYDIARDISKFHKTTDRRKVFDNWEYRYYNHDAIEEYVMSKKTKEPTNV